MPADPESFLRRAIALALDNVRSSRGGPFGAVVARDGRVVAEGANLVTASHDPTAHAEIVAIREACRAQGRFSLEGCQIYSSCEPCPMCLGAIYWARLDTLYFACSRDDASGAGFDDSFLYREIPAPLDRRSLRTLQLLRAEGLEALRAWQDAPVKIPY